MNDLYGPPHFSPPSATAPRDENRAVLRRLNVPLQDRVRWLVDGARTEHGDVLPEARVTVGFRERLEDALKSPSAPWSLRALATPPRLFAGHRCLLHDSVNNNQADFELVVRALYRLTAPGKRTRLDVRLVRGYTRLSQRPTSPISSTLVKNAIVPWESALHQPQEWHELMMLPWTQNTPAHRFLRHLLLRATLSLAVGDLRRRPLWHDRSGFTYRLDLMDTMHVANAIDAVERGDVVIRNDRGRARERVIGQLHAELATREPVWRNKKGEHRVRDMKTGHLVNCRNLLLNKGVKSGRAVVLGWIEDELTFRAFDQLDPFTKITALGIGGRAAELWARRRVREGAGLDVPPPAANLDDRISHCAVMGDALQSRGLL